MKTIDQIKADIDDFFSDTSRSAEDTLDALSWLVHEINDKMSALENDINR